MMRKVLTNIDIAPVEKLLQIQGVMQHFKQEIKEFWVK
jgi:hypothetical protein